EAPRGARARDEARRLGHGEPLAQPAAEGDRGRYGGAPDAGAHAEPHDAAPPGTRRGRRGGEKDRGRSVLEDDHVRRDAPDQVRAARERRAHEKYRRESPRPPAAMRGGRTAAMVDRSFSTGAGAQPRKAATASLTSAGRSIGTKWPARATVRSVPAGRRRIASAASRSPKPGLCSPRTTSTGTARRSRKPKPSLRGAF